MTIQPTGIVDADKTVGAARPIASPALTSALLGIDDYLRNPQVSARVLADIDEWCDRHTIKVEPDKEIELDSGIHMAVGGRVIVHPKRGGTAQTLPPRKAFQTDKPVKISNPNSRTITILSGYELRNFLELFQTSRLASEPARKSLHATTFLNHLIWLCADPAAARIGPGISAHLLASAIAEHFKESAVVVEIVREDLALVTRHVGHVCQRFPALEKRPTEGAVVAHVRNAEFKSRFHHILYVNLAEPELIDPHLPGHRFQRRTDSRTPMAQVEANPDDAKAKPAHDRAPGGGFDRIVHITRKLDLRSVEALNYYLKEAAAGVFGNRRDVPAETKQPPQCFTPMFGSYIPTFINSDPANRYNDRKAVLDEMRPAGFDRLLVDPEERPPSWRLVRDSCWLELDAREIEAAWQRWEETASDISLTSRLSQKMQATLDHWARAATNRQVGLALSGGGASSYRFIPALRAFAAKRQVAKDYFGKYTCPVLPIDIVSGVSGGALIGAYYCAEGVEGLERAIEDGAALQLGVPAFAMMSKTLEWLMDYRFGQRSIATFPTKFVPVAVCLMRDEAPETRMMLNKSVGKAVRASGSLPLVFGPSEIEGELYSDGGFGTIIPSQAVAHHGADLIVGVNCIAGPALGSPFEGSRLFGFLRRWTFAGRAVDLWISVAYLQQETSRLIGRTEPSPLLIEPARSEGPFAEMPLFGSGARIARNAEEDESFQRGMNDAIDKWNMFRDLDAGLNLPKPPAEAEASEA